MTFGERMKKRRTDLGKTQEDVAEIVGVTKQTIQKYENHIITNIPSDKIELVAKALDIAPCSLMGWDEELYCSDDFTEHEIRVIRSYRKHPEMQLSVDKLLGINSDYFEKTVKAAARSSDNSKKIEERILSDSEKEAIKNKTLAADF